MMRFIFTLSLSAIALVFVSISDAEAKYSLCNKTSYTLSAAIGFVDGDRLATRGWWRLRSGQCKVVLTELTSPGRYFVYAEGIPGHNGPLRAWSGETPLCVENSGFFSLRNQEVCRDKPSEQRGFFDVEVTAAANGDQQTDFVEASNFTVYSSEVAGVQRLLRDVGKSVASIDGSLGRKTRALITAYRKEKNLGEGAAAIDDALVDALIKDANARDAKLGFFFCNKVDQPIWSAIGQPGPNERTVAKGWWKLEPGSCAKVIKGELESDHYFVYGVIDQPADMERRLVGGDTALCINAVKFDIATPEASPQSCDERDFDEAVFRRFNIGSASSATFDFQPDMFSEPQPVVSAADEASE